MSFLDWLHRYEAYMPVLLRIVMGAVFIFFGIDKLVHPDFWAAFIPPGIAALLPLPIGTFEWMQGAVEILVGSMLVIGLWRQVAAMIASLMLIPIIAVMFSLGAWDIALRDIGLLAIAISLAVTPETMISIDAWLHRRKHRHG